MSEANSRLTAEAEGVKQHFSSHPKISIVSSEGTPPEKYEIEFHVEGLARLDGGDIVQSDQHRVEISLSFGFPHFPPNCKPLTEIFHPDIDPSAIKIADFWDKSKSLVDLIYYIARMISWQVYSAENVFNPTAMEWLADHSSEVPVDDFDFSNGIVPELSNSLEEEDSEVEITLSDDDLPALQFQSVELGAEDDGGLADTDGDIELPEIDFQSSSFAGLEDEEPLSISEDDLPEIDFEPSSFIDTDGEKESMHLDLGDISAADIELDESSNDELKLDLEPSPSVDEKGDGIVIENIAVDETHETLELESYDDDEIDLDLNEVDVDFDILTTMIDQHKFYAARKKFMSLPVDQQSKEVKALHITVEESIDAAEVAHGVALDFESKGLIEKAAGKLEEVMEMVVDFPGLEADMKRVRNAWMLLGGQASEMEETELTLESSDLSGSSLISETELPTMEFSSAVPTSLPPASAEVPPAFPSTNAPAPQPVIPVGKEVPPAAPLRRSAPVRRTEAKGPFLSQKKNRPIVITMAVLVVAVLLSLWGGYEWRSYAKAEKLWGAMNSLLETENFEKAKADCERIKEMLGAIKFFKNKDKQELLVKVDDLLGSEHFLEGIEGRILYKGRYVSKRAHRAYEQIEEFVNAGEKQGASADWQGAVATYEKAQKIVNDNKERLDPATIAEIDLLAMQAKFAHLVSLGKKYFIGSNWPQAISSFEQAMELAKQKGVADPSTGYDVHRYLQRARFSQLVVDGDNFLKKGKWAEAVEKFTVAQKITNEKNIIDPTQSKIVLIKQSQTLLLRSMRDGDAYRDQKKWGLAVNEYQTAAKVIREAIPLPGKSQAESEKIVYGAFLGAVIQFEQKKSASLIEQKKYIKARESLLRLVEAIKNSSFAGQSDMVAIRQETEKKIRETELASIIEEKTAYLMEHYQEVFTENFAGVRASALSQPQIEFQETKGNTLIFFMRCREKQDVKYFTLELFYQFDMVLDQWGFGKG